MTVPKTIINEIQAHTILRISIFICTVMGVLLLVSYAPGDGSLHATGYEFGKMIGTCIHAARNSIEKGIRLSGALLALVVSYKKNRSVMWAIFHGILGWGYICYHLYRERGQQHG